MVDTLPIPPTVQNLTFRILGRNSLLGRISEPAHETSTTDNGQEEDNLDDSYVDIDSIPPEPSGSEPSLLARMGETTSSTSFPVQPAFFRPDGTFTRAFTPGLVQLDTQPASKGDAIEQSMASLSLQKPDVSPAQLAAEIPNVENGPTVQEGDTGVKNVTHGEASSSALPNLTTSSTAIGSIASKVPSPPSSSTALQTHQARPPVEPLTIPSQETSTSSLPRFVYRPLTELLQEEKAAWSEVLEKKQTQALTTSNFGLGRSSKVPFAGSVAASTQALGNPPVQSAMDQVTQNSLTLTVVNNPAVPSQPTASGPTLRLIPVLEMPAPSAPDKEVNSGIIVRSTPASSFPSSFSCVDNVRNLVLSGPQATGENLHTHVPGPYVNSVAAYVRESSLSSNSLNTSKAPCPPVTTTSQQEDLQHTSMRGSAVDSSEGDHQRSDTPVDTSRQAASADIPSHSPVELPERPLSAMNTSLQSSLPNENGEAASPACHRKGISSSKRKASASLPPPKNEGGASKRRRVKINKSSKSKPRVSTTSGPQPNAVPPSLLPKPALGIHPLPPKPIFNHNGTSPSKSVRVKRKTVDSQAIKTEDNDDAPSNSFYHLRPSKQVKKEEDEDSKVGVKVEEDSKLRVKVEEDLKSLAIGAGPSNIALKPPKDEQGDTTLFKTEQQTFLHDATQHSQNSASQERIGDARYGRIADPLVASETFNREDPPRAVQWQDEVQWQGHQEQDFRRSESNQQDCMQEDIGQQVLAQNEFGQEATEEGHPKADREVQGSTPKNVGSLSLQNLPRHNTYQSIPHQSEQSFGSARHVQSQEEAFNESQGGDRADDQRLRDASSEQLPANLPAWLLSRSISESTMSISPLETPWLTHNEILSRQSSVPDSPRPAETLVPVDDGVLSGGETQVRRSSGERAFRLRDHWSPTPAPQRQLRPRPADTYRPRTPSPERFPPQRILDSYRPTSERESTPPRYTWKGRNRIPPSRSRSRSPIHRRAVADDTRSRPTLPPLIRERDYRRERLVASGSSGAMRAGVSYAQSDPSWHVGLRLGPSTEQGGSSTTQSQRVVLDNISGIRRCDERMSLEPGNAANTSRTERQFVPNATYLRSYERREGPGNSVNRRTPEYDDQRETVSASAAAPLLMERELASVQHRPVGYSEFQHNDLLRQAPSPQIVPSHGVTLPRGAQPAHVEKCTDGSGISNAPGVPSVPTSPSANGPNHSGSLQQTMSGPCMTEPSVNVLASRKAHPVRIRRYREARQVESAVVERDRENTRNDSKHTVNASTQAQHNRHEKTQSPVVFPRQSTAVRESTCEVAQQTISVVTNAGKSRDLPPSPVSRKGQEQPRPSEDIQDKSTTSGTMPEYAGKPTKLETSPRSLRDRISNETRRSAPARQYPSADISSAVNLASRIGDTLVIDESARSTSSTVSSVASPSPMIPLHLRLSNAPQEPPRRHPLPSRVRPYHSPVDEQGGTGPSSPRGQPIRFQATDEPSLLTRMNGSGKENARRRSEQNRSASRRAGQEQVLSDAPKSFAARKRPLGERLS